MLGKQIFARKTLKMLLDEMTGEHQLKRVLGPLALTSLGVGAVIGAGIFVATGEAAHKTAGPALMLSYVVAGVTCVFAALCYAEFASMAPVAGSAYTYAYATMGELLAWIIGWDLVLEYAVGAATVGTNVRKGYVAECPNVGKFIGNLKFNLDMEGAMMDAILKGADANTAATDWLKKNPDAVTPWLNGVTTFDGGDAAAAVKTALGS